MLSNLRPNYNLGNYFETYATPLLLPQELADKELLVSEVGCYNPRSNKSSNKGYNNHSDCDSNSNSKGNIRADLARNTLRRKRKECVLPRYLVCENCGEKTDITKDEDGGTN